MNKILIIYTQDIAAQLMLKGNKLMDIKPNHNNPSINVFFFKDNIKIQEDLKLILKK